MSFISNPAGVVGYSNQQSTAAPNDVKFASYFLASGAAASIDAVIGPKGAGALLAQVPDSAVAGGNKRGNYAVDLQLNRTAAANIAFGPWSVLGGGYNNRANGQQATVAGGSTNAADGNTSTVGGGSNNQATNTDSTVSGGGSNTATASQATVAGGGSNDATGTGAAISGGISNRGNGDYCMIPGGSNADARGAMFAFVRATGTNGVIRGDSQEAEYQSRGTTTTAAATTLTADAAAAIAANLFPLDDFQVSSFSIRVVAFARVPNDYKVWQIDGTVQRLAGVATVTLLGAPVSTVLIASGGAAAWTAAVAVNVALGRYRVDVAGAAGVTIKWSATAKVKEVRG